MQPTFNANREKNNRLYFASYRNDYCYCAFQFHSQIEIYFVDEGEMDIQVGGQRKRLTAGQLSVALSYDVHDYRTPVGSRSSVLLIPPDMCAEFSSAVRGKRLATPFITDRAVYDQLKQVYEQLKQTQPGSLRQLGCIYTILGLILEHIPLVTDGGDKDTDLASRLLFYINENFQNDITPASVARQLGYNQSYISRFFKRCFGITLCKYLNAVRLRNVAQQLQKGSCDITRCALDSGFSSVRTFYRAFREEYGCSPTQYLHRLESE